MSDEKPSKEQETQERIERAKDASVPQIYFNGFVSTISPGDVHTILERNGKPVAVLNMSYTLAKTLAISLGQVISHFEAGVARSILTTHEVEAALSRTMNAIEAAKKETKQ